MLPLPKFSFHDRQPPAQDFRRELLDGLSRRPRTIAPKFFYDEAGSRLFDRICETPEYYPTRTELAILRDHAQAIARRVGRDCLLIEPGSGSSSKVRTLLDPLRPQLYVPVDISGEHLRRSAAALVREYPWLRVCAACTDFTDGQSMLPVLPRDGRRVVFFPGSTIGNFEADAAAAFLARLAQAVGDGGGLLIGVDLRKDPAILEAAYNDAAGITAAFNMNLLARANRELSSGFDLTGFAHRAFYNHDLSRVEMHLDSLADQRVGIGGRTFEFRSGESIHTENAYKYSVEEFSRLAGTAGFLLVDVWIDPQALFSVQYYTVAGTDIEHLSSSEARDRDREHSLERALTVTMNPRIDVGLSVGRLVPDAKLLSRGVRRGPRPPIKPPGPKPRPVHPPLPEPPPVKPPGPDRPPIEPPGPDVPPVEPPGPDKPPIKAPGNPVRKVSRSANGSTGSPRPGRTWRSSSATSSAGCA